MKPGLKDLLEGLKQNHIFLYLGYEDMRQKYIRTTLGPLWLIIGTFVFACTMSLVMGSLFGQSIKSFLPFVTVGIATWTYIATNVSDATIIFIATSPIVSFFNLPISIQLYRCVTRNFLVFLHSFVVIIPMLFFMDIPVNLTTLLFIPGVILLMLNLLWVTTIFAMFATRFRDFQQVINILIGIVPFVTPIFWQKEFLSKRQWIVDFNPVYHAIEIIRAPLLGQTPNYHSWYVMGGLLVFGFLIMILFMNKYRNRVVFWL